MRILINHMTRMHGGYICLAGIDLETRRHVRPILADQPLPFYLMARYGGPFEMARVVDLGSPRPTPDPPHVEDYVFVPARAKSHRPAAAQEFWRLLLECASESLQEIFGPELREIGQNSWGTSLGEGRTSLGVLRPVKPPELFLVSTHDGKQRIRMKLTDGRIRVDAGVTDLRLYGDDHATPDPARVRAASQWMLHGRATLICVGLTRRFRISAGHDYFHWLQVNNIHVEEEPIWRLG